MIVEIIEITRRWWRRPLIYIARATTLEISVVDIARASEADELAEIFKPTSGASDFVLERSESIGESSVDGVDVSNVVERVTVESRGDVFVFLRRFFDASGDADDSGELETERRDIRRGERARGARQSAFALFEVVSQSSGGDARLLEESRRTRARGDNF